MLLLKRPIAFIDIESTGINFATDRIIELSVHKIKPDKKDETKTWRVNPGIPIPVTSSEIHGIYDKDIKDAPLFKEVASEVDNFIEGCDLAGFNSGRFDIPILMEEFMRCDLDLKIERRKMIDVQKIFHQMEKRTLEAAYEFYCGKTLENAHSAEADARATYEVLCAQLERYKKDIQNDIDFLHEFSKEGDFVDTGRRMVYKNGEEYFNFGKHKGRKVVDVLNKEPQYYDWIMKSDFPLHTKRMLTAIKIRMK